MPAPPLILFALAAEAAPLLAQATRRRWPTGARAWVLVWCAFGLATDLLSGWLGFHGQRNLWLYYIFTPVSTGLVLWTLSYWQQSDLWRLTYRLAVVPLLLVWGVIAWAFEDTSDFSHAAEPTAKLVALAAAAFTLVMRSYRSRGDLRRQDWFWISGALTLYFGVSAAISPLGAALETLRPDLLVAAWSIKGVLDAAALLLITRGILCPTRP